MAWLTLALGLGASNLVAATRPEYEIKAALILNFTRYVEWPEETFPREDSPFVIGIFGTDPFGQVIDGVMEGRTSQSRPLVVRRIERLDELAGCHVVFVSTGQEEQQVALLQHLRRSPILTVGESDRFLEDGGAINLVISRASRVGFEVNLKATEAVELHISSRMLKLARLVIQAPLQEAQE